MCEIYWVSGDKQEASKTHVVNLTCPDQTGVARETGSLKCCFVMIVSQNPLTCSFWILKHLLKKLLEHSEYPAISVWMRLDDVRYLETEGICGAFLSNSCTWNRSLLWAQRLWAGDLGWQLGGLWMMSSFRQGNYIWLDQQQSKRKFKLVVASPISQEVFPGTSCFPSKSMRQVLWFLLLQKVFRVWTGSSCSPFCIQPFGSFSLAPCLRSRQRRRTPSIFLSKLWFIFPNTDSLTLRLDNLTI